MPIYVINSRFMEFRPSIKYGLNSISPKTYLHEIMSSPVKNKLVI